MLKLARISTVLQNVGNCSVCDPAAAIRRRMSHGFFTQGVAEFESFLSNKPTPEEQRLNAEALKKFQEFSKASLEGGGPRGIERHVKKNKKMLVRDRIKKIIDPGSTFVEIGSLAGFDMIYGDIPAGGVVTGIGKVCGVYCVISGNDATVKGGTYFPITLKKSLRAQEIAQTNRLPCIYIPDSGGAYLPLQAEIFLSGGRSFYNQAVMSSTGIYQVAVVCGSCTAGGAYNPTMSDEAIIVENIGKIYLGGPPLVRAATGEIVSDEDLGGAFMHSTVSGCTDYFAKTEEEAFIMCRDVVESLGLPSSSVASNFEEPKTSVFADFIAKAHYDKTEVYSIIASITDGGKFKEFKAFYGPGLIVGTAYIQGRLVGIVANCDQMLSAEALKGTHFIRMCNTRQIPLVFLQNSLLPEECNGSYEEEVLKDRGKMSAVVATAQVPKIALTLSACHDDDNLLMCGPSFSPNFNLTWPTANFSSLSMEGLDSQVNTHDAFTAAFNMNSDLLILPETTRSTLGELLKILDQQFIHPNKATSTPILRM